MKDHNLYNRKKLLAFRKSLRNNSTSAEIALWNILKSKKLDGRKFRRQHSINNYIVDFCCISEKLIIELDGYPHGDYIKIENDKSRDKKLEMLGFTVLRFENRFIFQDLNYVINEIKKVFRKSTNQPPRTEKDV